MKTFRDIIGLWPSHRAMAGDCGAKHWAVAKWHQRDRIPAEWWNAVVDGAAKAGHRSVTVEILADIASSRRAEAA